MLNLDENEKEAVRNLGESINRAIEKSNGVASAIEDLRALGFEPNLTLKLEIALQKIGEPQFDGDDFSDESDDFELTEEDVQTLRRMKIRFE